MYRDGWTENEQRWIDRKWTKLDRKNIYGDG
jgi:hypothetical protein